MAGTESAPSGRVRWRRVLLVLLLPVLGVVALTQAVGGGLVLWAAAGLGGVLLLGGGLAVHPWVRHHAQPFGPRSRHVKKTRTSGSLNYPGQRGKGLRQPLKALGRPGSMGRRHRSGQVPFRRRSGAGSRAGTLGRRTRSRSAGTGVTPLSRRGSGTGRNRGGSLGHRRQGAGTGARRRRLSPFAPRRGSGAGPAASRRRSGGFPGLRRRSPGAGRGSPGFRGSRRTSPGFRRGSRGFPPFSRRFRPSSGTGRRPSPGSGGGRPGARTSRRRFSLFRPGTWTRRGRTGTGGSAPRSRSRRAPGGWQFWGWRRPGPRRGTGAPPRRPRLTRPGTWFRRGSGSRAAGGKPPRWRNLFRPSHWHRRRTLGMPPHKMPGPLRYAWWRLRGSPGAGGTRGTRRRALRTRRAAWKAKFAANPDLPHHRSRLAPWRVLPGARKQPWLRYRWRRKMITPRGPDGRPLGWRARLARRWRIWRGHAPGIIRMRARPKLRARIGGWLARLRRARPPRQVPAWLGLPGRWLNRRRNTAWMRRRKQAASQPQPRRREPANDWSPGRGWNGGRGWDYGNGTTGRTRTMSSTQAESVADDIESLTMPEDAEGAHETFRVLHRLEEAVNTAYGRMAQAVEGMPGVHPDYSAALAEHAAHQSVLASDLEARIGRGITG